MLAKTYPYYLANKSMQPNTTLEVRDKYSGKIATRVALADAKTIDKAIAAAEKAAAPMRKLPPYARQAVLEHCVTRFRERKDELAMALKYLLISATCDSFPIVPGTYPRTLRGVGTVLDAGSVATSSVVNFQCGSVGVSSLMRAE